MANDLQISRTDAEALLQDLDGFLARAEVLLRNAASATRTGKRSGRRLPSIGDDPGPPIDSQLGDLPWTAEEFETALAGMEEARIKRSRPTQAVEALALTAEVAVPIVKGIARIAGVPVP